jgi:hypothetical protein
MFKNMQISRKNGIIFVILVVAVISVIVYLSMSGKSIKGFRFYGPSEEQRMITMTADLMKTQKGFFSFGSGPTVLLENGYIDIYGFQTDASTKAFKFGDIFSPELFAAFPVKNFHVILAKPVTVRIHDEKSIPTQLFAASATFRLKERDILFNGDVRVLSVPFLLTTDQLILLPDKGLLKIDKPYVLRTSDKRTEGINLMTDIFLRPVDSSKN